MFIEKSDLVLNSSHRRKPIAIDARWVFDGKNHPVVIFVHGVKGYKDWGTFNLIADYFAANGFAFVKMNLSHNGTTLRNPTDFADLDAFGENNFSIELDDIAVLIDHLFGPHCLIPFLDLDNVTLIGHSRGGALSILKSAQDRRITKTVSWAPIPSVEHLFRNIDLEQWKEDGVFYIENSRTHQQMPLKWQIMEDYFENQQALDVNEAASQLKKLLLIFGTKDLAIPINAAQEFIEQHPHAQTMIVEDGEHTFGGKEPYTEDSLPLDTWRIVERTIGFIQG